MNLRDFETAFKAQIINVNRRNALMAGGGVAANYFTTNARGSVVVNAFWNNRNGPNNLFNVTGAGIENWQKSRNLGLAGVNDTTLGRQCGILYNAGVNVADIQVRGNNVSVVIGGNQYLGINRIVNVKNFLAEVHAAAPVGGAGATRAVLASPADDVAINAWFALTVSGGGAIADANLTPAQIQRLHTLGWNPADIRQNVGGGNADFTVNDGAGNAIVPAAVGFAAVNALGEKAAALQTFWTEKKTNTDNALKDNNIVGNSSEAKAIFSTDPNSVAYKGIKTKEIFWRIKKIGSWNS